MTSSKYSMGEQYAAAARPFGSRTLHWHHIAAAFLLLHTMGAFSIVDRTLYGEWADKSGDKLTQVLNLLAIGINLVLFWRGFRQTRTIGIGGALALSAAAFFLLSACWAIDPATTVRRGILYTIFILGVIGIAANLDGDEFLKILGLCCFSCAGITLVLLAVSPGNAYYAPTGDFRGVFGHKNVLGQAMAAAVIAYLHGLRIGGWRWRNIVMLLVAFVLLVLAKSSTALMTAVFFCGADTMFSLLRRRGTPRTLGAVLLALLLPAAVVFAISPDLILDLIGKDSTLTGRTELWTYVNFYIDEKPILGWGLGSFWSPVNPRSVEISAILGWDVPQAHNGLLEMRLEVGIVGTAIVVILWLRNALLAVQCLGTPARELGQSSLLCYGGIVLVGITEEVMMDYSQISTYMFFLMGLMCERALRASRRQRYPIVVQRLPSHWSVRP